MTPIYLSRFRFSAALLASLALSVAGCGDASVGTSGLWHGGSTPQAPGGGTSSGGSGGSSAGSQGSSSGGNGASAGSGTGSGAGSGTGSGAGSGSGGGSGGSGPQSSGSLTVTVDNASPSVDLLSSTVVNVTITPTGFSGAVTLSTSGLSSDVTPSFDNANVTLSSSTAATAMLTLATLSSTVSGARPFTIVATSASGTDSAAVSLTVNPVITIDIPVNADANQGTASDPRTDAFGAYPIMITAPAMFPVTVNFHNSDSTPHEIHADQPAQGFPHGAGLIASGANDTPRNVTASGTYDWHLHDQNAATTIGQIVIGQ
jgi:hypothetical protein